MKTSRTLLAAAALTAAAFGALADEADGSQYAVQFNGTKTRAEVQAELAQYKQAGVNPWSTSYNPLNSFRSAKTRAQVTAEYLGNRDAVAAFTAEDSGSTYLAQHQGTTPASRMLAGTPVNAQ
jgi:hypothetical protein